MQTRIGFLSQIIVGVSILKVWNIFGVRTDVTFFDSFFTMLRSDWLNLRDINNCEYGVGALLVAAPFIAFYKKDVWLTRAAVAFFIYVLVVVRLSPQSMVLGTLGDVRYLAPLIPLCILIGVRALLHLCSGVGWAAVPVSLLIFGTNIFHGSWTSLSGFPNPVLRSTIASYLTELAIPVPEPFTPTAAWLNEHVQAGQSVWVVPGYVSLPLMFLVPKIVYAWQLPPHSEGQYSKLPPIHFYQRQAPDYIVTFGANVFMADDARKAGDRYELAKYLPIEHEDKFRAELNKHAFTSIPHEGNDIWGVHIFKKVLKTQSANK